MQLGQGKESKLYTKISRENVLCKYISLPIVSRGPTLSCTNQWCTQDYLKNVGRNKLLQY